MRVGRPLGVAATDHPPMALYGALLRQRGAIGRVQAPRPILKNLVDSGFGCRDA